MKVLIACEVSGVIREAFRKRGHSAWSCDIRPCEDGSNYHLQADAREVILAPANRQFGAIWGGLLYWDLIIMHPPCQCLCVSGNAHYAAGKAKHSERIAAIEWTMALWELAKAHAPMVCMENPQGVLPIKPTQYVQPYEFGHNESKKTGLWLHGLSPLQATKFVPMPMCGYRANQTPSGQNKLGPSVYRSQKRARSYQGIADAMSTQWG